MCALVDLNTKLCIPLYYIHTVDLSWWRNVLLTVTIQYGKIWKDVLLWCCVCSALDQILDMRPKNCFSHTPLLFFDILFALFNFQHLCHPIIRCERETAVFKWFCGVHSCQSPAKLLPFAKTCQACFRGLLSSFIQLGYKFTLKSPHDIERYWHAGILITIAATEFSFRLQRG